MAHPLKEQLFGPERQLESEADVAISRLIELARSVMADGGIDEGLSAALADLVALTAGDLIPRAITVAVQFAEAIAGEQLENLDDERAITESLFLVFQDLLRRSGEQFIADRQAEIQTLVAHGSTQENALIAVASRAIAENGPLDQLGKQLGSATRSLISQATVGVFQKALDSLQTQGMVRQLDPAELAAAPGEQLIWISVRSSDTCRWKPTSAKYELNGVGLTEKNFCWNRQGMRGDQAFWDDAGRPRTGVTVCGANCECTLVPDTFARQHPGLTDPLDLSAPDPNLGLGPARPR